MLPLSDRVRTTIMGYRRTDTQIDLEAIRMAVIKLTEIPQWWSIWINTVNIYLMKKHYSSLYPTYRPTVIYNRFTKKSTNIQGSQCMAPNTTMTTSHKAWNTSACFLGWECKPKTREEVNDNSFNPVFSKKVPEQKHPWHVYMCSECHWRWNLKFCGYCLWSDLWLSQPSALIYINTLKLRQNGYNFADKFYIFLKEIVVIWFKFNWSFVTKCPLKLAFI